MNGVPNFLIVGTAKAGTTTIYEHLLQSNDVFPHKVKEPSYFSSLIINMPQKGKNDHIKESLTLKTWEDYKDAYRGSEAFKVVGDFSVENLYYSKKVIPLIKERLGDDIKILIVLRNPVDRAISAYKHLRRDLRETESIDKAIELEQHRIQNDYAMIWHYISASYYYENVKDYMQNFKNVKVMIYEEMRNNESSFMNEIFSFLEISPVDLKNSKNKHNFSYIPKNKSFQRIISWENPIKRKLVKLIPLSIRNYLKQLNSSSDFEISAEFKKELDQKFAEDKMKLEKLLDRDLSIWKTR